MGNKVYHLIRPDGRDSECGLPMRADTARPYGQTSPDIPLCDDCLRSLMFHNDVLRKRVSELESLEAMADDLTMLARRWEREGYADTGRYARDLSSVLAHHLDSEPRQTPTAPGTLDGETVMAIVRAWEDPGPRAGRKYHRHMQGLLRAKWPTLSRAIERLVDEVRS